MIYVGGIVAMCVRIDLNYFGFPSGDSTSRAMLSARWGLCVIKHIPCQVPIVESLFYLHVAKFRWNENWVFSVCALCMLAPAAMTTTQQRVWSNTICVNLGRRALSRVAVFVCAEL